MDKDKTLIIRHVPAELHKALKLTAVFEGVTMNWLILQILQKRVDVIPKVYKMED